MRSSIPGNQRQKTKETPPSQQQVNNSSTTCAFINGTHLIRKLVQQVRLCEANLQDQSAHPFRSKSMPSNPFPSNPIHQIQRSRVARRGNTKDRGRRMRSIIRESARGWGNKNTYFAVVREGRLNAWRMGKSVQVQSTMLKSPGMLFM